MNYFAYGSNLDPIGMQYRCPYAARGEVDALPDHALVFAHGLADVQPADGRDAAGAVWYVNDEDLERLDVYEGYPQLYRRNWVTLASGTRAIVYTMANPKTSWSPTPFYLEMIVRGYDFWQLPYDGLERAVEVAAGLEPIGAGSGTERHQCRVGDGDARGEGRDDSPDAQGQA